MFTTPRCTVRRFTPSDAEAALGYLGDPGVMEFVEPPWSMPLASRAWCA